MTRNPSVEERLANVEKELADLKGKLSRPDRRDNSNWITNMIGQFKDDPVFAEIVRLGKKIRDADQPPVEDTGETEQ